jgi:NCAIR mutase (PurE)-related protein
MILELLIPSELRAFKTNVGGRCGCIYCCCGMEGTLPGVITALVNVPVIGVPTSSGYGFKGNGEGALTTMLQSCSPGLMVVNIDNGFGAGACAALIAKNAHRTRNI